MYKRLIFAAVFFILLCAEVYIGIFVHDRFIRPYVGDVLVVIVLYALIRIAFPEKPKYLSLWVLLFAFLVEFSQMIPLVDLLGIHNRFLRILMGTSYADEDLIAYAVGTIPTLLYDIFHIRKAKKQGNQ